MITWLDLLIGLLPFVLVALLLWIRLRATGLSTKTAAEFIVKVFALITISVFGLGCVVEGWRDKNSLLLMVGVTLAIAGIFTLRWNLRRMWEKFPLPLNGNSQNGTDSN